MILFSWLTQILGEFAPGDDTWYLLGLDVIGQQTGSEWSYFGYDALGSVRMLSDASGDTAYAISYDPYGVPFERYADLSTQLGFTGEYTDPTGLLYLRARYASPADGAFLSRDPFEGIISQSVTRNGYLYANANPVNLIDPSGSQAVEAACGILILSPLDLVVGDAICAIIAGVALIGALSAGNAAQQLATSNTAMFTPPSGGPSGTFYLDALDLALGYDDVKDLYRAMSDASCVAVSYPTWTPSWTFNTENTTTEIPQIQTISQEEARSRENDESQDIVYRNPSIDPAEHPEALVTGFYAKNPGATYTIEGHILNGSREGWRSQYISLTRSLEIAIGWKTPGIPIYAINLNDIVGIYYDLTTSEIANQYLKGVTARNWANSSQEILVVGWIPPTAIKYLIE